MAWKIEEDGSLTVNNGNPIWVYEGGAEAGKEAVVEFGKTLNTIANITKESIDRKTKINEYKAMVEPIQSAGIDNIAEYLESASKAIATVASYSDKDILDVGQVDKIKASITDGFGKQIEALKTAHATALKGSADILSAKDASIKNLVIRGAFDASEFLKDSTVLIPDMAYSFFGDRFDVEADSKGNLAGFARDREGNKLMSIQHPGDVASPMEAIEILVNEHPQKDRLLKLAASGSGSQNPGLPGQGGNLMAQYNTAKTNKDVTAMIEIKGQMAAQGIKAPL